MKSRLLICVGLLGLLGLGACGKQGSLDRPGPLFQRRSEHRAMRDAAARGAALPTDGNGSATSQTNGDYSHASDGAKDPALLPLRTDRPPGMSSGPGGGGRSGGVLPDPYSDPNRAPR